MSEQNVHDIVIRRARPEDSQALRRIHEQPRIAWGALQGPYRSAQLWRQRLQRQIVHHTGVVAAVDLADRWLALRRLELAVPVDNDAAVRLYKKWGFKVEGLLRHYSLRDGGFVDVYTMARVR